jgi:hypothetical protein
VIDAIAADAWMPIAYPDGGEAAVAETTYVDRAEPCTLRRNLWP